MKTTDCANVTMSEDMMRVYVGGETLAINGEISWTDSMAEYGGFYRTPGAEAWATDEGGNNYHIIWARNNDGDEWTDEDIDWEHPAIWEC